MTDTLITLVANALWGGAGLVVALASTWLVRSPCLHHAARTVAVCTQVSGISVFVHRTFWNIGIVLRTDGAYALAVIESRQLLLVPVLAIVVSAIAAVRVVVPRESRRIVTFAACGLLAAICAGWVGLEVWLR